MKKMKEMLKLLAIKAKMKLQEEKGEVSVEWAMVAIVMALVILATFSPGIQAGLNTAFQNINGLLGTSALPS